MALSDSSSPNGGRSPDGTCRRGGDLDALAPPGQIRGQLYAARSSSCCSGRQERTSRESEHVRKCRLRARGRCGPLQDVRLRAIDDLGGKLRAHRFRKQRLDRHQCDVCFEIGILVRTRLPRLPLSSEGLGLL